MRLALLAFVVVAGLSARASAQADEARETTVEQDRGTTVEHDADRASSALSPPVRAAVEEAPDVIDDRGPLWPSPPRPPIYETWWFWTAIGAVVLGVTLAIVVGVTTDDPATSRRAPLVIRF